jgi:hypothetical protein
MTRGEDVEAPKVIFGRLLNDLCTAMTEDKGEPEENLDGFLQYFVRLVNRSGLEIGITLNVSGLTISGQLISSKSYFEGLIQEMSSANTDNQVKLAFQEAFRKIGGIYSQMDDEDNENQTFPTYIHLRNAKMLLASGQIIRTKRGVLWRGRLSEVDGFCLGAMD